MIVTGPSGEMPGAQRYSPGFSASIRPSATMTGGVCADAVVGASKASNSPNACLAMTPDRSRLRTSVARVMVIISRIRC
ncbi:hypothetical protein ASE90_01570 [Sphingomonas sp. Leaf67]|nr:hypothetical protein ASE90_01570 [Sphingomonas sp. Leaf67]